VAALIAFALLLPFLSVVNAPAPAEAANAADFNPGNIISDAQFYSSNTMTVGQVQAFLNAKVPNCQSGYTCLKNYRADSSYQPARAAGCAVYPGPANQSAAEIIWQVSSVCGINPQVMLVLLEKEQGLVSRTSPTAAIYRKATGFGCPDTAVCDSVYYGFFNQVYNAAYQYKKYQASPGGRNFQAGRWNTIQWHPNAACGTSQVYIENQATAGLYIYTPYRPNNGALSNMYGTADGCSSYGNRNFFRIFTDWFGNTQGGGDFARTADNGALYLLSGTRKYPVASMDVYNTLANLGPHRVVSQSYLDSFSTSALTATSLVRDPGTGDVALVRFGVRHRFPSCALVAAYGHSCAGAIDLAPSQLGKLPSGAPMSSFFTADDSTVYMLVEGGRSAVYEWNAVIGLNGGTVPYVSPMSAPAAAKLPILRVLLNPTKLVKSPTDPTVYFIDGFDRKLAVPSFALASEFGANGFLTVPQAVLDGYTTGVTLTETVRCGGKAYFAAQGGLRELATGDAALGLPTIDVSADTCARLPKTGVIPGQLFLMSPESGNVYGVKSGVSRLVPSWSTLLALNAGSLPPIVTISPSARATIPAGAPYIGAATLARSTGNPTIYLIDGADRKIRVGSFTTASALGVSAWSYATEASFAAYAESATPLTRVIRWNGADHFASGGRLYQLAAGATHGFPVTELSVGTGGLLAGGGLAPLEHVFVKSADAPTVYVIDAGKRRPVGTWEGLVALNGGKPPVILIEAPDRLSDIQVGPAA